MDSKVKMLEARIRELVRALDIEKKGGLELQKQIYKRDRKIKEMTLEAEEAKQKFKSLEDKVGDLETELRIQRRKFEETQEICTMNQVRFRKVHGMYLNEVNRTEQYEEQLRRKRAAQERTTLFVQA